MRKDHAKQCRKGKLVAQGSHGSLGALLTMFNKEEVDGKVRYTVDFEKDSILDKWLNGIFTKICLMVENDEELVALYERIKQERPDIPCVLITDCGLTEFNSVPTNTCVGIGPYWSDEIDVFTKELKLFQ